MHVRYWQASLISHPKFYFCGSYHFFIGLYIVRLLFLTDCLLLSHPFISINSISNHRPPRSFPKNPSIMNLWEKKKYKTSIHLSISMLMWHFFPFYISVGVIFFSILFFFSLCHQCTYSILPSLCSCEHFLLCQVCRSPDHFCQWL